MSITAAQVKELREKTGAGMLDCRKALETYEGDFDKAADYLREKGLAVAVKKAEREAKEGLVEAYGHPGGRVGVLLEVNCETDFAAGTDDFKRLVHDLALHIAFAAPKYRTRDEVPAEVLECKRDEFRSQALEEGKPENIVDRIVDGRLEKFYRDACLMEQPFVKDEDATIEQVIKNVIAKLGENIVVRRFVRYERGEVLEG